MAKTTKPKSNSKPKGNAKTDAPKEEAPIVEVSTPIAPEEPIEEAANGFHQVVKDVISYVPIDIDVDAFKVEQEASVEAKPITATEPIRTESEEMALRDHYASMGSIEYYEKHVKGKKI